jgi:hypothetical protein
MSWWWVTLYECDSCPATAHSSRRSFSCPAGWLVVPDRRTPGVGRDRVVCPACQRPPDPTLFPLEDA